MRRAPVRSLSIGTSARKTLCSTVFSQSATPRGRSMPAPLACPGAFQARPSGWTRNGPRSLCDCDVSERALLVNTFSRFQRSDKLNGRYGSRLRPHADPARTALGFAQTTPDVRPAAAAGPSRSGSRVMDGSMGASPDAQQGCVSAAKRYISILAKVQGSKGLLRPRMQMVYGEAMTRSR